MRVAFVLTGAMIMGGCATAPSKPIEVATVECEASSETGEVRNCVLISQTIEGSDFGEFAVGEVGSGRLKPSTQYQGWRKFSVQVRGRGS